jgi:hypothetical protein
MRHSATLRWKFKDLKPKIREICDDWQNQFKTQLNLTSAILKNAVKLIFGHQAVAGLK